MKLVDNTKPIEYKKIAYCDLEYGDVFEDATGNVFMKIVECRMHNHTDINAIRLEDGYEKCFGQYERVYPLETTLHYKRMLEGD